MWDGGYDYAAALMRGSFGGSGMRAPATSIRPRDWSHARRLLALLLVAVVVLHVEPAVGVPRARVNW